MRSNGVKAAKVLSCIIAAVIIINSTQTACASSQAAFDMSIEEEQILLEEAVSSEEESEIYEEASDDANISWDDEIGVSQEEKVIILEEAEDTEENGSVILDDQEMILEEEILDKLGEAELEAAEEIILTEEDIEVKNSLVQNDVLADLLEMEEGEDYVEDQIIALASGNEEAELIARAYGGELIDFSYGVATISLKDCELTVVEAFQYGINPDVSVPAVEPDYLLSFDDYEETGEDEDYADFTNWNDQYYIEGHNDPLLNPAAGNYQWHHEVMGCFDAWNVSLGSSDITVAVIDSGVKTDHDDLKDAIVDNYEQVNSDTAAIGMNDSNDDGYGHGTHVAGLIAASIGNGKGGSGVAPGAKILPINVCKPTKPGSPVVDYMIKAIQYVAGAVDVNTTEGKVTYYKGRRADIINMSIGSNTYSAAMEAAVNAAYAQGVTIVAAMGNDGSNLVKYPARYDHVIGVCATKKDNTLAEFSDFGSWADISSPGSGIYSTSWSGTDRYESKDGTSMASPIIAGACALYMSYKGHVSPDAMEKALKSSATKALQPDSGAGVVNVAAMLGVKATTPSPVSANLPIKTIILDKTYVTLSSPAAGVSEIANINVSKLVNTENQDLTELGRTGYTELKWSSSDEKVARISGSTGGYGLTSVTIVPVSTGTATITCQVMDKSSKKAVCKVKVVGDKAVTEISLKCYNASSYVKTDAVGKVTAATLFRDAPGSELLIDDDEELIIVEDEKSSAIVLNAEQSTKDGDFEDFIKAPVFKNSNSKVVRMDYADDSGKSILLTALAKGTAKITATASDGSGKSTSVYITVKQIVTGIEVTGQAYIQAGTKATYKATVKPSDANNKKVKWEAGEDPGNGRLSSITGVTISSGGVVSVAKNAVFSGEICVRATSEDDGSITGETTFMISPRAESVYLNTKSVSGSGDSSVLAPADVGKYKSTVTLVGYAVVPGSKISGKVNFSSSNQKVASIENVSYDSATGRSEAIIRAHKKGKVTITCSATDGSKKSAKLKFSVVIPVSGLTLTLKDNLRTNLAYGGSAQALATIGKAYGKPDNSKVIWDYDIVAYRVDSGYDMLSTTDPQLLEEIKKTKSFFEFNKGKIKVNKKEKFETCIRKYGYDSKGSAIYKDFGLKISVSTADGSGFYKESSVIRAIDNGTYIDFYQYIPKTVNNKTEYTLNENKTDTIVVSLSDKKYNPIIVDVKFDSDVASTIKSAMTTVSSNTAVASAYSGLHSSSGITGLVIYPYKIGESNIIMTLRDGSGFKRALKIKVVE
ncbi:S8 family serine peptidase [Butyrivibrio sp. DSM 10294]|uniref:S8 family serine peptidase n=1 Tax=Butyrivibrio sp. DSM 10294 TaxID=2972457 RepID=UPI00234F3997|nr:S8 family serine peptidase [Butyrivibrio sp. DSM 10294]MDC7294948.1 S8 family serine peptidase [Butyrivibrio sp. DSM 10294]